MPYSSSSEVYPHIERERAQTGGSHGGEEGGDADPRRRSGGERRRREIRPEGGAAATGRDELEIDLGRGKVKGQELHPVSAQFYSGLLRAEVPLVGAGTSGPSETTQTGQEQRQIWRKDSSRKYRSERPELPVNMKTVPGTGF